ncbi:MAG: right-handed parallel beta-helix repeat-containing protein [Acidobacteriota bacterium]
MSFSPKVSLLALPTLLFTYLALTLSASAVEAQVVVFDHNDVLAGGITPGDAPGYPALLKDPGSYRLDGNLFAPNGVSAVEIDSPEVTLDLDGFTLFAVAGNPQAPYGINGGNHFGTTVKKGTIEGFGYAGIRVGGDAKILEMRVIGSNGIGIDAGALSQIHDVQVRYSDSIGVRCAQGCQLSQAIVSSSGTTGISCGDDCQVERSISRFNGYVGIWVGKRSNVHHCTSARNKIGLVTNGQSLVTHNVVVDNNGEEIIVGDDSGTATNVVDDVEILNDHELDPSACIGGLCL